MRIVVTLLPPDPDPRQAVFGQHLDRPVRACAPRHPVDCSAPSRALETPIASQGSPSRTRTRGGLDPHAGRAEGAVSNRRDHEHHRGEHDGGATALLVEEAETGELGDKAAVVLGDVGHAVVGEMTDEGEGGVVGEEGPGGAGVVGVGGDVLAMRVRRGRSLPRWMADQPVSS